MAGFRVEGNTSGNVAEVDASNNLKVTLPQVDAQIGGAAIASLNDAGSVTGNRYIKYPRTSEDNRLMVGINTPLASYVFNATAQNTATFKYAFTTMTASMSGGFLNLNANSTATTTTGVQYQSWQYFPMIGNGSLHVSFTMNITAAPLANQVFEGGLFIGTSTTAPADGVYVRLTTAGLVGVLNFNGTESTTSALLAPATFTANQNYEIVIIIHERVVEFWREGIFLGELNTPVGNGSPFQTVALPLCFQQRNSGAVTGTQMQVKIADAHVDQEDVNMSFPFPYIAATMGQAASQGQDGGTMGSTALYTNSLAPGAGAAIANATAAAGFTGLGGQHTNTGTLAASTDGILSSYQNPAGGVGQTPRTLIITGIRIQTVVTAAMTGGPMVMLYSLAYGHTAVSMATAEGTSFTTNPTTKAPRRIPLGIESIPATSAIGTVSATGAVQVTFNSPIAVNPGEFVAVCAKNVGTVMSVGTLTTLVTYDAFWR